MGAVTSFWADSPAGEHDEFVGTSPFRVLLVGIAGTSRDFLLSLPTLKAFVSQDKRIAAASRMEILHHKYILPSAFSESCLKLLEQILMFKPDLLGFSTYVWNIDAVIWLAQETKKALPRTRIVLGGPEVAPTNVAAGKFDASDIDFLIVGEGEIPFQQLLQYHLSLGDIHLDDIPRLCFRRNGSFSNEGALQDANIGLLPDLSGLPSPYLNGGLAQIFLRQPDLQANVETQRGCNFRCAYCLYHAHFPTIRYRNADMVLQELQYLNECGIEHCRITDANFLSNQDFAATILRGMIDRRLEMSLFVEVIPSFVTATIADLMARYRALSPKNTILVGIGLQSINPKSLKAIRRHLPLRHFDNAYALLAEANAVVKTDVILGLPHETPETYVALLEYIGDKLHYGANWLSISLLRILPGTELETFAKREALVLDERDREHFVYATPTLPREQMVKCLRLSTAEFRLLHAPDGDNLRIRERYFAVKTRLGTSHAQMLAHFAEFFLTVLEGSSADYVKDDFPNAEHYWYYDVFKDVPDQVILSELARIEQQGGLLAL